MTRGIFVAGTASSSELNDCFDPPRARVYNSSAISLTSGTDTTVTFNSERWDTATLHSTAVNTSRFTIGSGDEGFYDIGVNLRFASNATGTRQIGLWVNGVTTGTRIALDRRPAVSGAPTIFQLTSQWQLAAGDYVEVAAFQDSGGALDLEVGAAYGPEFWICWRAVY